MAAVKVQEKVQVLFSDAEENYFTLMKLYDLLNNTAAVEEQYGLLKKCFRSIWQWNQARKLRDGMKAGNKQMLCLMLKPLVKLHDFVMKHTNISSTNQGHGLYY